MNKYKIKIWSVIDENGKKLNSFHRSEIPRDFENVEGDNPRAAAASLLEELFNMKYRKDFLLMDYCRAYDRYDVIVLAENGHPIYRDYTIVFM